MTQYDAQEPVAAPVVTAQPRPLYWSLRREVWENRSVYLAPLIVAAVVLFGTFIATMNAPARLKGVTDPAKRHAVVTGAYDMAPAPIMLTTLIVGIFYCLDALYGERRDRSILFWKSMPVSDRTTVIAKALIPLVILPAIAIALSLAVQLILIVLSSPWLLANGVSPAEFRFLSGLPIMLYGLGAHILWFAPIYAWFLLVSAWAKRAPFLWAVLPPLAIGFFEWIVFRTSYFGNMLHYRLDGAMKEAFIGKAARQGHVTRIQELDPVNFLSTLGLWVGLAFAWGCLAAAIRLRRNREPI